MGQNTDGGFFFKTNLTFTYTALKLYSPGLIGRAFDFESKSFLKEKLNHPSTGLNRPSTLSITL